MVYILCTAVNQAVNLLSSRSKSIKESEKRLGRNETDSRRVWRTATSVLPRLIAFVAIRCYLSSQIFCM